MSTFNRNTCTVMYVYLLLLLLYLGPHCKRMQYAERQQVLQQQYFFTCKCDSCRNEGMQELRYLVRPKLKEL